MLLIKKSRPRKLGVSSAITCLGTVQHAVSTVRFPHKHGFGIFFGTEKGQPIAVRSYEREEDRCGSRKFANQSDTFFSAIF